MKNPKLIVKPFAKNGQKNVIPENYETSMDSNQATWDQGFGQITMLPVAAGGLPPKGQDFNGILNQISENIVYQSQGGRFKFSPEYAESIGGYPKGAILQSDDEKKEYQSLIDNNKVNFNTTSNISASWELVGSKYAIKTEVDLALLKKFDKENISGTLGNDNSKVPSLNLLTTEIGKLATKGELTTGLAGKQPVGDYATNTALSSGLNQKLNTSSVVQSAGSSTAQVMSQKAVTDALENKINTSAIVQTTGQNQYSVMSQKATTDALDLKVNYTAIVQTTGQNQYSLMSQKAVTDAIAGIPKNTALKSDNGWWKCGNTGLIIQWGRGKSNVEKTFPIAFPTSCAYVQIIYGPNATNTYTASIFSMSSTSFLGKLGDGNDFMFCAIGY